MEPFLILGLTGLGLVVGTLIGCVGIGGVLIAPALIYLGGVPAHSAVASAMLCFVFTGAFATYAYRRRGLIESRPALWLCAGALPGGFLGAALMNHIPEPWLKAVVAAAVIFSGVYGLVSGGAQARARPVSAPGLGAVGLAVGVGSSLSGTAGALLLIPVLAWLGMPAVAAIGLSQVISIPIATLATVGNALFGQIDWVLGAGLGLATVAGIEAGAAAAARMPQRRLRRLVAAMLVLSGTLMAAQLAARL